MKPLISIIVPVYNVEKYLDRCVNSIIKQTYQNLEIILVDDGSTDGSGEKCDEWSKKDSRIVVIHKNNGGLSDARNVGMSKSNGEYIGFVDSDDYVSANMYESLYSAIIKYDADIAECQWIKFEDESAIKDSESGSEVIVDVYTAEEALSELILERKIKQTVVNKLYQRNSIQTCFPVGRINEDDYWTYQVFGMAKKIVLLHTVLYYYFQRSSSIMHVKYSPKRLDGVTARKERMEYMQLHYPNLFNIACLSFLWSCFYHYQVICRNDDVDIDFKFRKLLHTDYCDNYCKEAIALQPFKQRVWMRLFKSFPSFTCKIRNILKIGL